MMHLDPLAQYQGVAISRYRGSITNLAEDSSVDAIVNPANKALCLGWGISRPAEFFLGLSVGGVSKAIGKKSGSSVREECKRRIKSKGWLNSGEAVYTSGGNLPVKYIIHVASTDFFKSSEKQIKESVRNSLNLAYILNVKGIAYPLLGAGSGRISSGDAARWMCEELKQNLCNNKSLNAVVFAMFTDRDYKSIEQPIRDVF